jgi:hypothetical protein
MTRCFSFGAASLAALCSMTARRSLNDPVPFTDYVINLPHANYLINHLHSRAEI